MCTFNAPHRRCFQIGPWVVVDTFTLRFWYSRWCDIFHGCDFLQLAGSILTLFPWSFLGTYLGWWIVSLSLGVMLWVRPQEYNQGWPGNCLWFANYKYSLSQEPPWSPFRRLQSVSSDWDKVRCLVNCYKKQLKINLLLVFTSLENKSCAFMNLSEVVLT